jgi:hypothetical protein
MYSLHDDDLRMVKKCWRRNVLIIKLHTDIVHLVHYDKTVYEIIHRMMIIQYEIYNFYTFLSSLEKMIAESFKQQTHLEYQWIEFKQKWISNHKG